MALAQLFFNEDRSIAVVTINRPDVLNAIDVPTARAIHDVVVQLPAEANLRAVILRGAGRAFVSGGDVAAFAADFDKTADVVGEMLAALNPVVLTLRSVGVPVLASVHGAVAGAGISLMCAADLVIASQDTRFMLAYNRVGAPPDCGGTWFLPRLIGQRKAAEFMYLGDIWDAATAKQAGLINVVVPADRLVQETDALAERLASGATRAFAMFKQLTNEAFDRSLPEQLALERSAFQAATRTEDFRDAVRAFLDKKPAKFHGK